MKYAPSGAAADSGSSVKVEPPPAVATSWWSGTLPGRKARRTSAARSAIRSSAALIAGFKNTIARRRCRAVRVTPRPARAKEARASARATSVRFAGEQSAISRSPSSRFCIMTCTRAPPLSTVNVARAGGCGRAKARSICDARRECRRRRSAAASALSAAFCVTTSRTAGSAERRKGVFESGNSAGRSNARAFGDAAGAAAATERLRAKPSAEYQACESSRRSIAATGADKTPARSSSVIMAPSSPAGVACGSLRYYRGVITGSYCGR